jgi:hypothetical protein
MRLFSTHLASATTDAFVHGRAQRRTLVDGERFQFREFGRRSSRASERPHRKYTPRRLLGSLRPEQPFMSAAVVPFYFQLIRDAGCVCRRDVAVPARVLINPGLSALSDRNRDFAERSLYANQPHRALVV